MNPTIFLVDDDEDDRFILSMAFADLGLRESVVFFSSGLALIRELEKLLPSQYPGLIVTDWHMPQLNGKELLILLKKRTGWCSIPIVVLSHVMVTELRERLIELGALACFEKTSFFSSYKLMAEKLFKMADPEIKGIEVIL